MNDNYLVGVWIVGVIAFIIGWIYAIASYGFFLGLGLGWIPAAVVGLVAGFLWPLLLLAVVALVLLFMYTARH